MDNLFKLVAALVFAVFGSIYCGIEIAAGNYALGIVVIVIAMLVGGTLMFGKGVQFDHLLILAAAAGYMLAGKGFAYTKLGPIFFVGELALAVGGLFYLIRWAAGAHSMFPRTKLSLPLAVMLMLGGLRLMMDFPHYGLTAVKDSCLVYYIGFFFIAYRLGQSEAATRIMGKYFPIAGLLGGSLYILSYYSKGFNSMLFYGTMVKGSPVILPHTDAALNASLGALCFFYWRTQDPKARGFLNTALMGLGLFLVMANVRGVMFIALALTLGFFIIAGQKRIFVKLLPLAAAALVMGAGLMMFKSGSAGNEGGLTERLSEEMKSFSTKALSSATAETTAENTVAWRILWWKSIFRNTVHHTPIFGVGFGEDIASEFHKAFFNTNHVDSNWERIRGAHSALFTFMARMGFTGTLVFLWIIFFQVKSVLAGARMLRSHPDKVPPGLLFCLGYSIGGFAVTFFQYTWESPYAAIPFWINIGIATAMVERLTAQIRVEEEEAEAEAKAAKFAEPSMPVATAS